MKIRTIYLFIIALLCGLSAFAQPNIIPLPGKIITQDGLLVYSQKGTVSADASQAARNAAGFMNNENLFWPNTILNVDKNLATEAYRLAVSSEGVRIEASDYAGFFNGSRTLAQLIRNQEKGTLPIITIEDAPCLRWRGAMLDVARHYFDIKYLYKLVDVLSDLKMNVFHIHLTDDQGWRVEIKAFPKLTEIGAWRKALGWDLERESGNSYRADGQYGGFYTQEMLKDLVEYAAQRNVTIVPELDFPGHSTVAVANYPEWIKCDIEGKTNVYCPGHDKSYIFIEKVLDEIFEIFPSKYVMIGADEVNLSAWKKCPRCQAMMKEKGYKDERQLQHMFGRKVAAYCRQKGRMPIGWDEIIDGEDEVPEVAVMMRFGDARGVGVKVTGQNRELINAKSISNYFDYSQGPNGEPRAIGASGTWERTYLADPIPSNIAPEKRKYVLGTEGALWTEFVPNEGHTGYMIFPRIIALAEAAWTATSQKNIDDFRLRLNNYLPYLVEKGISYRPDGGLLKVAENKGKATVTTPIPNARIYYTLDGSYPTRASKLYRKPFKTKYIRNIRALVVGPQGNEFPVRDRTLGKQIEEINAPKANGGSPERYMLDDDFNTFYRSAANFDKGNSIVVKFAKSTRLNGIKVVTGQGNNGGGKEFITKGRLQISYDGQNFKDVAEFKNGVAEVSFKPIAVKAVRFVADENVNSVLRVREIYLRNYSERE